MWKCSQQSASHLIILINRVMIFQKETSLLTFFRCIFLGLRAPKAECRLLWLYSREGGTNSNTRKRRSIYFVFTSRWTVPLRLLSLADKLLTAITQACPISCGMQKQIGRRWYHREAVCLSSSLSGCSPGCQKCRPSSNLHKHFLSVNRNTVILKTSHSLFVSPPTLRSGQWRQSALRLYRRSLGQRFVRLLVESAHPSWCWNMWEEVTYLKYAATGASHSKIPWSFCKPRKTKPVFCFSPDGDVQPACVCVCVCEHSVKCREKSRESQKMSWFLISSRPRDGWQRLYAAKASAQRHAHVHAELAPSTSSSCSHRYHRNLRKCSAGRNLGRARFDTARCELAGGQLFFFMKATQ